MLKTEEIEPAAELKTQESEGYQLIYTISFYNCTITNLHVQQTGKPSDPEEPQ